jgi:hypothetical protein
MQPLEIECLKRKELLDRKLFFSFFYDFSVIIKFVGV